MNREKLLIAGAFVSMLAVVMAIPAFHLQGSDEGLSGGASGGDALQGAASLTGRGPFRGIWLQLHANDDRLPYEDYIREIHATGADTVCLSLAGYQENASSSTIFIEQRKAVPPERLVRLFELAQSLGMKVVFMPIVLLEKPGAGEWRGKINPADKNAWWQYYGDFIVHYAGLAQRHKVDLFMVGSELVSTEHEEQRWRDVIARVRNECTLILDELFRDELSRQLSAETAGGRTGPAEGPQAQAVAARARQQYGIEDLDAFAYSQTPPERISPALREAYEQYELRHRTLLSYSSNWDHYEVVKFWDALDAIGMTSYYNINKAKEPDPSLETLLKAWEPIRQDIRAWQQQVGKPVLFTEVGWASQDGCSIEPWNYYRSKTVDLVEQQRCMESFLRTFGDEPYLAGILIWKWRDYPGMTGGPTDYSYTPYGKPVLQTIQDYFRRTTGRGIMGRLPGDAQRRYAKGSTPVSAVGS